MPWKRRKSGRSYRTTRGGSIKKPAQYEALRRRGMSKTAAARIANSKSKRSGGRKKR